MNNEIKEILDNLRYTAKKHTIQVLEDDGKIEHCPQEIATEIRLNTYSANILLDYITNLQQENNNLKTSLDESQEVVIDLQEELEEEKRINQEDLKYIDELNERIEKAVEYIKELISATKGTLNDMNYCDKIETITQYVESLEYDINHYEYLLNILNGRSDE